MSGYTPPKGHSVAFDFGTGGAYVAPPGHSIKFDIAPDPITLGELPFFTGEYALVVDCPEYWHPFPGNQIDFNFNVHWVPAEGSKVDFDYHCEAVIPSGTVDLGRANAGEGSTTTAILYETLAFNFSDGSVFVTAFTDTNINLPSNFYEGSEFTFNLATLPQLAVNFAEGSSFVADITPSTFITLQAQVLDGSEIVNFDLITQSNLDAPASEGAGINNFDLTTRLAINPVPSAQEGAEVTWQITVAQTFAPNYWDGSEATAALTTIVNTGMLAPVYEGAEVSFTLYNVPGFILQVADGAESVVDLSASYSLGAQALEGSEGILGLDTRPNIQFTPNFWDGSEVVVDLSTTTTFSFESDDGAEAVTDITLRPAAPMILQAWEGGEFTSFLNAGRQNFIFNGYEGAAFVGDFTASPAPAIALQANDGSSAAINISWAINLGEFDFADGTAVHIDIIDINPIINAWEGSEVELDLATEYNFPQNYFDGGEVTLDLSLRPSEGMGNFIAWDGAGFQFGALATLISASMHVTYYNSWVVRGDIDSGTDFDLTTDACCGPRDPTSGYIDMGLAEAPDWHYYGYKQIFTVDLSCRPRFSAHAYDGSTLTSKDYSAYFTFNFFDGASSNVAGVDQFMHVRLCKGNFIPNADNVVVELTTVDTEDCEANFAYEGGIMSCVLENNIQDTLLSYMGSNMTFDIGFETGWSAQAWDGAWARVLNPEVPLNTEADGVTVSFTFYEPPILGFEGAICSVEKLTTEYDVEFLEVGCLENEYIPTNENGDPEPELARRTPMEMDPFYHEIKARCF